MDYPGYFTAAPQPYQFLGLPPTPAHTGSAHSTSDDFDNSPPVRGPFSYVPTHSSSLSPQNQYPIHHDQSPQALLTSRQDHAFDNFQTFDYNNFQPNHGLPQQQPNTKQGVSPNHKPSITANNGFDMQAAMDMAGEEMRRGSNSDDDDNMTPAQSRRKAQNRAAQRAFRERKERHVKDLEAKLLALEKNSNSLSTENERLRLQLQKASTENEILKATSSLSSHHPHSNRSPSPSHIATMRYSPTDFYTEVLHAHENKVPSHRIVVSEEGEKLLAAGATWDYIIKHPLYKRGMVDVGDVSERLKKVARCDGQGPVFEEREIVRAIECSVASGSDELL